MPPVHGMSLGSQLRAEICPHRGHKPRAPSPGAKAEHGVCLYPCSGCTAPSPWNPHTINVILGTSCLVVTISPSGTREEQMEEKTSQLSPVRLSSPWQQTEASCWKHSQQ